MWEECLDLMHRVSGANSIWMRGENCKTKDGFIRASVRVRTWHWRPAHRTTTMMSRSIRGLVASSDGRRRFPQGMNWRFRVPDGERIEFVDRRMGRQSYEAGRDFGDFLVWRRDDVPAYQLAVVVDDAAMQISEVVRGEDLLRSTARQILLQRALGLPTPEYYHCALLTNESGVRLAKRHDALSLRTLRAQGQSPGSLRTMAAGTVWLLKSREKVIQITESRYPTRYDENARGLHGLRFAEPGAARRFFYGPRHHRCL